MDRLGRYLQLGVVLLIVATAACSGGASAFGPAPQAAGVMPTVPPATSTPFPSPTPAGSPPVVAMIDSCQVFPATNPWNTDVSAYPVDPNSANYLAHMNASTKFLHPDFGSNPTYGIPYITVPATQPKVPMTFTYASESDPGPYPFPPNAPIEGGVASTGDRHVIVIDRDNCVLYKTWNSHYVGPGWQAGAGAKFPLNTNALRPDYWTSADAAGLSIFAGLVRYYEVQEGAINHALRFTVHQTQKGFIHPATHY